MRKILARITETERDEGVCLHSLRATYETLLKITRYPIDKDRVNKELLDCDLKTQEYWVRITNKYNIPLYIDKKMAIDNENCLVYVDL